MKGKRSWGATAPPTSPSLTCFRYGVRLLPAALLLLLGKIIAPPDPRLPLGMGSNFGGRRAAARRGCRALPASVPSPPAAALRSPPPVPRSAPTLPRLGRPGCHQRALIDQRRLPQPRRSHLPLAPTTAQKEGGRARAPRHSGEARSRHGARAPPPC